MKERKVPATGFCLILAKAKRGTDYLAFTYLHKFQNSWGDSYSYPMWQLQRSSRQKGRDIHSPMIQIQPENPCIQHSAIGMAEVKKIGWNNGILGIEMTLNSDSTSLSCVPIWSLPTPKITTLLAFNILDYDCQFLNLI